MKAEQEKYREPIDYTQESFKKYESVKIQNFIQRLIEMGVSNQRFAKEMDDYFAYHSIRKQNHILQLKE